ncbi:triose-phosphate isomerase [Peptoniphilus equinus]|nr:triose-phosphate isomerase [Peptoniphilus equinus]
MKLLIAGNWKMNLSVTDTEAMLSELKNKTRSDDVDSLIIPPFTSLDAARKLLDGTGIALGAQNLSHEDDGAFTGEISADMLLDLGVSHVLVGHSERREYQKETDALLNLKVKKAVAKGLIPILCVGEKKADRDSGEHESVVGNQLKKGLEGVHTTDIIVAYEPTWAIGTGDVCKPDDAQAMAAFIKGELKDLLGTDAVRVLYGGSVKPSNVKELMAQPSIDGALVGGASLKADDFAALINLGEVQ